jgi:hypothetical protein
MHIVSVTWLSTSPASFGVVRVVAHLTVALVVRRPGVRYRSKGKGAYDVRGAYHWVRRCVNGKAPTTALERRVYKRLRSRVLPRGQVRDHKAALLHSANSSLSEPQLSLFQHITMKASIFVAMASAALVSAAPTPAVLDARAPPNVPSKSAATTQLAGLTVAAQGPQTGYSRDLFPHWITQSGACNTRETVLKRDGTGVVTDSACASTSGTWFSPYDGATWTAASDVDIDHMVPLSNAWKVRFSSICVLKALY